MTIECEHFNKCNYLYHTEKKQIDWKKRLNNEKLDGKINNVKMLMFIYFGWMIVFSTIALAIFILTESIYSILPIFIGFIAYLGFPVTVCIYIYYKIKKHFPYKMIEYFTSYNKLTGIEWLKKYDSWWLNED